MRNTPSCGDSWGYTDEMEKLEENNNIGWIITKKWGKPLAKGRSIAQYESDFLPYFFNSLFLPFVMAMATHNTRMAWSSNLNELGENIQRILLQNCETFRFNLFGRSKRQQFPLKIPFSLSLMRGTSCVVLFITWKISFSARLGLVVRNIYEKWKMWRTFRDSLRVYDDIRLSLWACDCSKMAIKRD